MDFPPASESREARKLRKQKAKELKRKRIEESGGVRPRKSENPKDDIVSSSANKDNDLPTARTYSEPTRQQQMRRPTSTYNRQGTGSDARHRFGRVMETAPCRNKPRYSTLSIAVPGSVVANCQTKELKTQLVGQIARAAAIYHVDEIIVFDDKLSTSQKRSGYHSHRRPPDRNWNGSRYGPSATSEAGDDNDGHRQMTPRPRSDPHTFMARVLQYCECPQYLRKQFFPMHPDLQFSGLLAPLDSPHHVREGERSKYREGVIMEPRKGDSPQYSLANVGVRNRPAHIDRLLQPGVRCTVQLDPKAYGSTGRLQGKVVSPVAPREDDGTYWGYTTRLAGGIGAVFDECPYEDGYDLKVGTSERGSIGVDDSKFNLPKFQHALVVFGGVAGIEECVDADESLKIPGSQSKKLFDVWVNTCPFQGSRTIRTEEAVLISLARLSPYVSASGQGVDQSSRKGGATDRSSNQQSSNDDVDFSDGIVSEESSEED